MQTTEILFEIKSRPINERLLIVKETIISIQKSANERMEAAVDALLYDYKNDTELTAFTSLDLEDFYEPK